MYRATLSTDTLLVRNWSGSFLHFPITCCLLLVAATCVPRSVLYGQNQPSSNTVEISPPSGARLESSHRTSLDFEVPPGKARKAVSAWLNDFKTAGWQVTTVDEDQLTGEYRLTKNGIILEIEFDDAGLIVPGEITISSPSKHPLSLSGKTNQPASQKPSATLNAEKSKPLPATSNNDPKTATVTNASKTRRAKETSLGSVASVNFSTDNRSPKRFWISLDGKRFAREDNRGARLLVNGQVIEHRLKEGSFVFSPNSKRFAYVAITSDGESLMVDHESKGTFAAVHLPIRFSPDSSHVAAFATKLGWTEDERCVVIDGNAGPKENGLGWELAFSGDSLSVYYGIASNDVNVMIRHPVVSGESPVRLGHGPAQLKENFFYGEKGRLGYIAKYGERQFGIVYDGRDDGQRLEDIQLKNVVVSSDGKHVAYSGDCSPVKNVAIHQGKRGMEFNPFENGRIADATLQISRDGKRVAYVVEKDKLFYSVIDGKPGPKYMGIDFPEFSPDSQHVAYIAMKGQSPVVVIDGIESQQYAMVSQPEFTMDSKSQAYYAELNGNQFMVLNGKRGGEYDTVHKPGFSDLGTTLIYGVALAGKEFIVINGRRQKNYQFVGATQFLDQDKQVAYLAIDNDDSEFIVVDQSEGNRYDRILTVDKKAIYVTAPGQFHYLAVKNDELFLVEETVE